MKTNEGKDILESQWGGVTRRRFIKRSSTVTIALVLADVIPAYGEGADWEGDKNCAAATPDQACGTDGRPTGGSLDPDQSCGKAGNPSNTSIVDDDGVCGKQIDSSNRFNSDGTCDKKTPHRYYDSDDNCGQNNANSLADKDEQCTQNDAGSHLSLPGDQDQNCGSGGGPEQPSDPDAFCRAEGNQGGDKDENCGSATGSGTQLDYDNDGGGVTPQQGSDRLPGS